MSTKHTNGPWEVVEHSWSSTGIYAGDKRVADLDIYDDATEENEAALAAEMLANARLIAAAPGLFHALNLVKAHLGEPECAIRRHVHRVMDAAIAKAAGESE